MANHFVKIFWIKREEYSLLSRKEERRKLGVMSNVEKVYIARVSNGLLKAPQASGSS